jgi:hypothetical protein
MAIVNNPTLINCDGVYNILFKSDVPWSASPRWEPEFQKNVSRTKLLARIWSWKLLMPAKDNNY